MILAAGGTGHDVIARMAREKAVLGGRTPSVISKG